MKIDESRWTVKFGDDVVRRVTQDEAQQMLARHREKNRAAFKGSETRLLRWLQEKGNGNFVSTVFTTTEGQFIYRTVWHRHDGGHLHTDVMTPEECPYEDAVNLAHTRQAALQN
jgi:hypothetical protein